MNGARTGGRRDRFLVFPTKESRRKNSPSAALRVSATNSDWCRLSRCFLLSSGAYLDRCGSHVASLDVAARDGQLGSSCLHTRDGKR